MKRPPGKNNDSMFTKMGQDEYLKIHSFDPDLGEPEFRKLKKHLAFPHFRTKNTDGCHDEIDNFGGVVSYNFSSLASPPRKEFNWSENLYFPCAKACANIEILINKQMHLANVTSVAISGELHLSFKPRF